MLSGKQERRNTPDKENTKTLDPAPLKDIKRQFVFLYRINLFTK